MQRNAKGCGEQTPPTEPEEQNAQHGHWSMQQACTRMPRRVCLIEEAHGSRGTEGPVPKAEPDIVVCVDEHGSRPQPYRAAADERSRKRRTRGGD